MSQTSMSQTSMSQASLSQTSISRSSLPRTTISSLTWSLFLPLATLALPAAAWQQVPAAPPPSTEQGMVVVRDAETGQLRAPTPLEARALRPRTSAAAAAAAASPPRIVVGPGGRRSVRLGERQMVYSVVTRDADGKLAEQCVHGAHAAGQALSKPAAPATKPEEQRHESR